jgi:hypothetical protein
LNVEQRRSYGGPISLGGGVLTNGASKGESDPGIEPEPSDVAISGKYFLNRGRKVYEMKNHLGNVLAVVSDLKIGIGPTNVQPNYVTYYKADIVEKSKRGIRSF